ncbi:MAG TPA: folate-binding protein [Rhizobiales bacterium]|nr:folate-binding protein [Hyphomicrobiales bacterium]
MSIISACILSGRSVLRISGPEQESFLQGLVSNDMRLLDRQRAIHAALLSPQGKILFDFFVIRDGESCLLDVVATQGPELLKRLKMYKLRSKVEIEDLSESHGVAALTGKAAEDGSWIAFDDPRLEALGQRVLAPREVLARHFDGDDAYQARRIQLGIAEGGADFASGEVFPHEANLDQLNGVSFTKGCYVGQEVVSRMRHKTEIRKRFLPARMDGPAPEAGSSILADDKRAGIMGSSSGENALALLRLDRIAGARQICCGETRLSVQRPGWADFEIPGAE